MDNIRLKIAYDGTRYLGWQKTKMGPSIEESLENVLSKILQHPIHLQAASRTDAGVHASGQVVNFFTSKNLLLDKLQCSLNNLLPKDIVVKTIENAQEKFHPTLDCKSKEYHYHVCYRNILLPEQRYYIWHYPYHLDLELMKKAVPLLIGERDFSSFCNTKNNSTYAHYTRLLKAINIQELPNKHLRFEVQGNNFLYKMVRNLIGTLIYVGCGKISLKMLPEIIKNGDRTKAGMTAPAHGLFLYQVNY